MPWIDDDVDMPLADDTLGTIDTVTDAEREAENVPILLFDHRDKPLIVRKVKVIGYVR